MKRFFVLIIMFLLSFSLIRSVKGKEPLTFSSFAQSISKLDLSFDNTQSLIDYMKSMSFSFSSDEWDEENDGIWQVFKVMKNFFVSLISPILFLVTVIADIGKLLGSVFGVILELVGFDFIGSGGSEGEGIGSGGGHGSGGGGIK